MNRSLGRLGWILLGMLLSFGLEYGAFPALGLGLAAPSPTLALTVSVALSMGPMAGAWVALGLGLGADALTGWGMGLNLLKLALTCAVCSMPSLRARADRLLTAPALAAGACLMGMVLQLLVLYISRVIVFPELGAVARMALGLALTSALTLGLHRFAYPRLCPQAQESLRRRDPRIGW